MTKTMELDDEELTVLIFSAHNCMGIGESMMDQLKADGQPYHVSERQFKDNKRLLTKLLNMYKELTGSHFENRL